MRKVYFFVVLLFIVNVSLGQPIIIAKWSFEPSVITTVGSGTNVPVSTGSAVADGGVQPAGSLFSAFHTSSSTAWSNPVGNGSPKSVSSTNWGVGDYYQFQVSTTSYSSIQVSVDQTGSSTGPRDFQVQYSTNGTTFTDAPTGAYTVAVVMGGWASSGTPDAPSIKTFDLSAIAAINDQGTIYIRLKNTSATSIGGGAVGTGGSGRIDNFTISGNATVTAVSFGNIKASQQNNGNKIEWSNYTETNIANYTIERSANGTNFISIASIVAKQNNNAQADYTFTDNAPLATNNYYRIISKEINGSEKLSAIVLVKAKTEAAITILGNPVKANAVSLLVTGFKSGNYQVTIIDMLGHRLVAKPITINGTATQTIMLPASVKAGTYILQLMGENGTVQKTLLVQ